MNIKPNLLVSVVISSLSLSCFCMMQKPNQMQTYNQSSALVQSSSLRRVHSVGSFFDVPTTPPAPQRSSHVQFLQQHNPSRGSSTLQYGVWRWLLDAENHKWVCAFVGGMISLYLDAQFNRQNGSKR